MNFIISKKNYRGLIVALVICASSCPVQALNIRRDATIAAVGAMALTINSLAASYQNGTSLPAELKRSYAALKAKSSQLLRRSKDATKNSSPLSATDKRSLAIATGTLAILLRLEINDWHKPAVNRVMPPVDQVIPVNSDDKHHIINPSAAIAAQLSEAPAESPESTEAYKRREFIDAQILASSKTLPLVEGPATIASDKQIPIQRAHGQVLPILFEGLNFAPALADKIKTLKQLIKFAAEALPEARSGRLQPAQLSAQAAATWLDRAAHEADEETRLDHLEAAIAALDNAAANGLLLLNEEGTLLSKLVNEPAVKAKWTREEERKASGIHSQHNKLNETYCAKIMPDYTSPNPTRQTNPFTTIHEQQLDDASLFDNLVNTKIAFIGLFRKIAVRELTEAAQSATAGEVCASAADSLATSDL